MTLYITEVQNLAATDYGDSVPVLPMPGVDQKVPIVAPFAITASVAAGVLTVTVTAGALAANQLLSGANVPNGVQIVAQLTGAAGSTGTYSINNPTLSLGSQSMSAISASAPFQSNNSGLPAFASSNAPTAQGGVLVQGSPYAPTLFIEIESDAICSIAFGGQTATTSNMRLAVGDRIIRRVKVGDCVSVITNT